MEPVGAARPGSRSGARAATGAGPHWCRERLIAAAPGRWRDGTGSGSWSCRRGCIRAVAGPGVRAAARIPRDAAPPGTARPRPRTRPTAQAGRRACKPARSAPFYRRIRIDAGDRALLAPARGHPGLAPGAALLPAQAARVQRAPDRIGANLRQPVIRLAHGFLPDALLRVTAIADPRATSVSRPHGREPVTVE